MTGLVPAQQAPHRKHDHLPYHAWAAFVRDASEDGPTSANGVVSITKIGTDALVRSFATDVELRFDDDEWSAFLTGAADGEFDFTDDVAAVS